MDAQSESCEPPLCDPQPSGKIRKAFKLFGKRKPGSNVASIFSMRGKGDGGPKSPPSRSKTLVELNEPTAPEAEAEQVDLDQEEEEDAPLEEFMSGNMNSENTPMRQSISSLTSAKSLSFLNMLRKGRRGVAGEWQTQTESQRPGRQRKGLKGLFSSVRWHGKEKEGEEETEPDPPLLASRTNSVEIIKESVPLTPGPSSRSVEEQQQEEKKQLPTQEGPKSSEDSTKVSEATKPPTNERLSTLLGDISSILSFDSLMACGDIVADVEAEWVKVSTRMEGPTTLMMNDFEKDKTSSSVISTRSKTILSPLSTLSPNASSKPSPTSANKPIPSPTTSKPIPSTLTKPAISPTSSPVTKMFPSMPSAPINLISTSSPLAKPTPTPSAMNIIQPTSTPIPTPITQATPTSTSTLIIQPSPNPTSVSIAQSAQGPILIPTSKPTISPAKPARSPKSSPEIKPATIPPSSPTATPLTKPISSSTHTPVPVSTSFFEILPPLLTPKPAAVTKTAPTPTLVTKPTQAPTPVTKSTPSIANESKHATSTFATKYTPFPPPFGKSPPAPAPTPRPKLITTFGLSTSRNTAPIKLETKQPTVQATKSSQSTTQTEKNGTTSRKASISELPAPIAKTPYAVSPPGVFFTSHNPVLKSPPCTAPPPILSRKVEEEDTRQEGVGTRDSVATQSLTKAVKNGQAVKPTSLSKIPVSGGGRPTKQQHREAQPNGDEDHSNIPTPVHEEDRPFSLSRESSSKEALSDFSTESGTVTPTLSHIQEDIMDAKLSLQASAHPTAGSTILARESKIPIKHGSTATYHSVQGRAEAARSKIPVSKMPVRRTSNKPTPAATAVVTRK
ncbi:uncharacterized protein LOC127636980 [Xyrauchen texanus]|uniref:uncharacterized protein LOC127636980 n=1 Tax=Xyrauchen texanus TaxID=154827 RepID=UPI00224292EE|nr:uncharacterized protein LOC127636980 [Xyrauchen texanus]